MIDSAAPYYYQFPQSSAFVVENKVCEPQWPCATRIGTGGTHSVDYFQNRRTGYAIFPLQGKNRDVDLSTPYIAPMGEIKAAFGRTFSRLPVVFGVSRQTLYNWLDGELPKNASQVRILELADAACFFLQSKYTPVAADLDRTLAKGRSFLDLIAEGESGRDAAERLVRLVQRGLASRTKVTTALAGSKSPSVPSLEYSTPAVDEGAE